jgi:hypothetical protein
MRNSLDRFKAARHAVQQQSSRNPVGKIDATKHFKSPLYAAHQCGCKENFLIVIARQDDVVKLNRFEDTGEQRQAKCCCYVSLSHRSPGTWANRRYLSLKRLEQREAVGTFGTRFRIIAPLTPEFRIR